MARVCLELGFSPFSSCDVDETVNCSCDTVSTLYSWLYNRLQRVNGLRSWFNSSSTRCLHCTRSARSRSACHRVKHYGAARCHAVHHSLSTTDHEEKEEEEEKTVSFTGMRRLSGSGLSGLARVWQAGRQAGNRAKASCRWQELMACFRRYFRWHRLNLISPDSERRQVMGRSLN